MHNSKKRNIRQYKTLLVICGVFAFTGIITLLSSKTVSADTTTLAPTENTTENIGRTSWNYQVAQSFSSPGTIKIDNVKLKVRKTGAPTDNLIVNIQTNSASNTPSGTIIQTSSTIPASALSTSIVSLETFTFTDPPTLNAGQIYWIVLKRDGAHDGTNYFNLRSGTNDQFPAGRIRYMYTDGTWVTTTDGHSNDMNGEYNYSSTVTGTYGCTYENATNYNSSATLDDGTCEYPPDYVPTTADMYYEQGIKSMYQTNLFYAALLFLITTFGVVYYFLIKWKK